MAGFGYNPPIAGSEGDITGSISTHNSSAGAHRLRLPWSARFLAFASATDGSATEIKVVYRRYGELSSGVVPANWKELSTLDPATAVFLSSDLPVILIPEGANAGLWQIAASGPWTKLDVQAGEHIHVVAGSGTGLPAGFMATNNDLFGVAPDVGGAVESFVEHTTDASFVAFLEATPDNYFDTTSGGTGYVNNTGTTTVTEALNSLADSPPWSYPVRRVLEMPNTFDPDAPGPLPVSDGTEDADVADIYVLLAYTDGDARNGLYQVKDDAPWLKVSKQWDRINWVHVDDLSSVHDKTRWFRSDASSRNNEWVKVL